jgi:hypothetical protein
VQVLFATSDHEKAVASLLRAEECALRSVPAECLPTQQLIRFIYLLEDLAQGYELQLDQFRAELRAQRANEVARARGT